MAPTKIAVVTVSIANEVAVNANTLVTIDPTEAATKHRSTWHVLQQKTAINIYISSNIPNIRVIYINVSMDIISPEKKIAAIPAAASKLPIMVIKQQQLLFCLSEKHI